MLMHINEAAVLQSVGALLTFIGGPIKVKNTARTQEGSTAILSS